jgi:hypothetical protein
MVPGNSGFGRNSCLIQPDVLVSSLVGHHRDDALKHLVGAPHAAALLRTSCGGLNGLLGLFAVLS